MNPCSSKLADRSKHYELSYGCDRGIWQDIFQLNTLWSTNRATVNGQRIQKLTGELSDSSWKFLTIESVGTVKGEIFVIYFNFRGLFLTLGGLSIFIVSEYIPTLFNQLSP